MPQIHPSFLQFQTQVARDYERAQAVLTRMPNPSASGAWGVALGAVLLWFLSCGAVMWMFELPEGGWLAICLLLMVLLLFPAMWYFGHLNQQRLAYWQQSVQMGHLRTLIALLQVLADDVHPQSGVKGYLEPAHSMQHLVRSKRSRSGKYLSEYFRHGWADLRFTLIDGSDLRLKLECKFKYKSQLLERSLRLQRGSLHYNTLLYAPTQGAQQTQHTAMISPQNYLTWVSLPPSHFRFRIEPSGLLNDEMDSVQAAMQTLKMCRYSYFYLQPQQPGRGAARQQAARATAPAATPPLRSASPPAPAPATLSAWVEASALRPRIQAITSQGLTLSCQGEQVIMAECQAKGDTYLTLQLKVDYLSAVTPVQLLRANPTLAHARFGQNADGHVFMCKSLLLATLNLPEFDAALQELLALSHQLRLTPEIPQRLRRGQPIPADEVKSLFTPILADLDAEAQLREAYYKLRLTLASGRRQKIYVRTDRQDGAKRPVLSLMTFAQPYTGQSLAAYLRANLEPGYGAMGLAQHGGKDYVVVSETQLWQTADAQEIETLLVRLAAMGDRLEREHGTADVF
jgi:hypothetical protein